MTKVPEVPEVPDYEARQDRAVDVLSRYLTAPPSKPPDVYPPIDFFKDRSIR